MTDIKWEESMPCQYCDDEYNLTNSFHTHCGDIAARYYKCKCGEELWTEELMTQLEDLPCGIRNFRRLYKNFTKDNPDYNNDEQKA